MSGSVPSQIRREMVARSGCLKRRFVIVFLMISGVASAQTDDDSFLIRAGANDTTQVTDRSEKVPAGSTGSPAELVSDDGLDQSQVDELWSKIRHLRQKVRLKEDSESEEQERAATSSSDPGSSSERVDYADDSPWDATASDSSPEVAKKKWPLKPSPSWLNATATRNAYRMLASGTRKAGFLPVPAPTRPLGVTAFQHPPIDKSQSSPRPSKEPETTQAPDLVRDTTASLLDQSWSTTGAPNLENKFKAADVFGWSLELTEEAATEAATTTDSLAADQDEMREDEEAEMRGPVLFKIPNLDIVTTFLQIVESQTILGQCTAGTDSNLGEGVVDKYAQERFRLEAEVAVNRANWLTRVWKYADRSVLDSEYVLHANLYSIIEMDEDIFAAGNCYDKHQYKDYVLFCPFAYRLPEGPILAKDLAVEYKYLSNSSEWFYIARKNAERVIRNMTSLTKAYHTYTANETTHTERFEDEILSVSYEDGKWSKPYFDCGGGNIWMMTYTVPFFGYANGTYHFKGTSGIDIDLRRVDIDQCPQRTGNTQLNIFAGSDKCKIRTTRCVHIPGLGFRRGSYRCECKDGFYFPDKSSPVKYYNGTVIEEEFEKKFAKKDNIYDQEGVFECLPCPEGCETCEDDRPCIVTLNWVMRTTILILEIIVICCLPAVALFTWRYGHIKVVRAASPALLRLIILGAFFIYCTTLVAYFPPNVITCSLRVWLREIGFSFAYGALMLKTWRISVIFRVRSAKAVKITDLDLIKRLGIIVTIFTTFLVIRTIVGPPRAIVARTADDLKAYICQTDWWDHVFTAMEIVLLVWGIRLCIVVRKAPSEFNESRFISMAIYNEFLLSIFLNVSMLFLQSPANPDLMYIIMFSHTQLTTTLLLVLIFGSKAYLVLRGRGKGDDTMTAAKPQAAKFLTKPKTNNSTHITPSGGSSRFVDIPGLNTIADPEIQAEIRRLFYELDVLRDKTARSGDNQFASRLVTMLQVARQAATPSTVPTSTAITVAPEPNSVLSVSSALTVPVSSGTIENGPTINGAGSGGGAADAGADAAGELRQRKNAVKSGKCKSSPKNSPDSGLGGLMFGTGGPHVNNVLACMTDKIVCATFSADPNAVVQEHDAAEAELEVSVQTKEAVVQEEADDQDDAGGTGAAGEFVSMASLDRQTGGIRRLTPIASAAPVASLALAAAPLLTFNSSGMAILRNYSAPNSRRNSYKPEHVANAPTSVPLSLVGDYANCGALTAAHNLVMADYRYDGRRRKLPKSQSLLGASSTSLCSPTTPLTDGTVSVLSGPLAAAERSLSVDDGSSQLALSLSLPTPQSPSCPAAGRRASPVPCVGVSDATKRWSYPLSPQVVQKSACSTCPPLAETSPCSQSSLGISPRRSRRSRPPSGAIQVDCTVRSGQQSAASPATPTRTKSRSRINTDDRERFTEEVTV